MRRFCRRVRSLLAWYGMVIFASVCFVAVEALLEFCRIVLVGRLRPLSRLHVRREHCHFLCLIAMRVVHSRLSDCEPVSLR